MARLGDICYKITDGSHNPPSGVPYSEFLMLSSKNIYDDCITYDDPRYLCREDFESENKRTQIEAGDILLTIVGTVGRVAVVPEKAKSICLQRSVAVIKPRTDIVLPRFLMYQIQNMKDILEKEAKGVAQKGIYLKQVESLSVGIFEYDIQKKIVYQLDGISKLISLRKQQLSKLDELVKSRFIEMFGDLERTTTIARYISELRGGKSLAGTEPCKNKVLKTGAATFGWFDPEQYKYLPTDYEPLPEHKVETGDVIISRMNTPELVGACSYVFEAPDDMYYPDRLWKAVLKENTNPIFLWQLLWDRDVRKAIKESSGGTSGTMHNISKPNLLAIKCIDAPIELQNKYAEFVKQTDKSKFEIQKSLEKLETLKKALMQKYFG